METVLVAAAVAAFIAIEVLLYKFWRSSDRRNAWQRFAMFAVGALALTALIYFGVLDL